MAILQSEQGGSVFKVKATGTARWNSNASLIVDSGASLHAFGHVIAETGASAKVNDGASLVVKPAATSEDSRYAIMNMGPNTFWYSPGSGGSPQFSASPGDLLWLANSASTGLWVNVSDGAAGSKWYNVSNPTGSNIAGAV